MKSLCFGILCFIFCMTPIYSVSESDFYIAPYGGINVNLDAPPDWRVPVPSETIEGKNSGNVFSSDQTIIIGGIDNLAIYRRGFLDYVNEVENYGILVSFSSESSGGDYFWFTKQSDPEFRRPFQIQLAGRIVDDGLHGTLVGDQYSDFGVIHSSGSEVFEATTSRGFLQGIGDFLEIVFAGETINYSVLYEFGIILPGNIENGILRLDDGTTYPIATGNDYSAEITVTAQLVDISNGVANPAPIGSARTFVLPISGYYDPRFGDGEDSGVDTSAALYVNPSARAANIDLIRDRGNSIDIASIDFSIFNLSQDFTLGQYDESVFLFLSSSSNPFDTEAEQFRFLHEDVGFGDAVTESNSIGYTITVVPSADTISHDTSGKIKTIEFDGTDYLEADGNLQNLDKRIFTAHYAEKLGELASGRTVHWHSYSGDVKLTLEQNHTTLMNAGAYKSTVYIHVVTDEKLGGTTV